MDVAGFVTLVGLAALVVLAGMIGTICGRARGRVAAHRRRGEGWTSARSTRP